MFALVTIPSLGPLFVPISVVALVASLVPPASANPCVAVAIVNTDAVSLVELNRFRVFREVPVGRAPVSLAIDPRQSLLYVANRLEGSVSVVDTIAYEVLETFDVGRVPTALELSSDGAELYVANGFYEGQEGNSVSFVDTETRSIVHVVPAIFDPLSLLLRSDGDGDTLYVGGLALREILVLDVGVGDVVSEIDISGSSSDIDLSGDGTKLYVTGTGVNRRTVSLIDLAQSQVVAEVPVVEATFAEISDTRDELYVSGFGKEISVLRSSDLTPVGVIEIDGLTGLLRVSPDGTDLAVAHFDRDAISIVSLASREPLATVALSGEPGDVLFLECDPLCPGDCNDDDVVSIAELIVGVNLALGQDTIERCSNIDINLDHRVSINELISAVDNALHGCAGLVSAISRGGR